MNFSALEIDDVPATSATSAAPAQPESPAAPQPPAKPLPVIRTPEGMATPMGVPMRPRMARCYGWLFDRNISITSFSTDATVAYYADKIDAAIRAAEALPEGVEHRDDLIADLRAIRRRTPDARVTEGVSQDGVAVAPAQVVEARRQLRDDLLAVEGDSNVTGAVVYWTMSGDDDLAKLREEWTKAELPEEWLPTPPSPKAALGRAAKDLQTKQRLIRQDPKGGWSVVHEGVKDGELGYQLGVRVHLSGTEDQEVVADPETLDREHAQEDFERVKIEFARVRSTVGAVDASGWLIQMARRLRGVSLRDSGGVYFIPKGDVDRFRAVRDALKAASASRVFMIPAMRSADAVAAVLDAVKRESEELAQETRDVFTDQLGHRAARTRVELLDALIKKIEGYEKLLNVKMTEQTTELRGLRKKLADYIPGFSLLEVD